MNKYMNNLFFVTDTERDDFSTWSSLHVPAAPASLAPLVQQVTNINYHLPQQYLSPCPLCNMGANTIDHWTHYCPVPHMVFNALMRPKQCNGGTSIGCPRTPT